MIPSTAASKAQPSSSKTGCIFAWRSFGYRLPTNALLSNLTARPPFRTVCGSKVPTAMTNRPATSEVTLLATSPVNDSAERGRKISSATSHTRIMSRIDDANSGRDRAGVSGRDLPCRRLAVAVSFPSQTSRPLWPTLARARMRPRLPRRTLQRG
jgi:hypothetical protein